MRKKIEWEWEKLDESTYRAKVIGGWLVKTHNSAEGKHNWAISETVTFIPDRDHEWTISKPMKDVLKERKSLAEDFSASDS